MPDEPNIPPLRQQQETRTREELETCLESGQRTEREFRTPEDLLRHDAARTPVPATLEPRLAESIAAEPPPQQSWWRRWLGR